MAVENSPIRAPGIGANSKRHDLDGTPGLTNSSLQYGDVKALESGQAAIENTRAGQGRPAPQTEQPKRPTAPPPATMMVPDPVEFAGKKLAGTAKTQGMAGGQLVTYDRKNWLPFLERLATSPTSSGILQRAYVQRLSAEMARPAGGSAAVLRQRDMDKRLREFNG